MDLTQLENELSVLGNVDLLEEQLNSLFICVKEFNNSIENIDIFNTISENMIRLEYPNTEALSFEGGSIKAIFTKV